ncbi:MAG: hypothetical protein AAF065_04120 [Verrucomicrobiota bacterium]
MHFSGQDLLENIFRKAEKNGFSLLTSKEQLPVISGERVLEDAIRTAPGKTFLKKI